MRALLLTLTTCLLVLPANAKYSGGSGEPNDPYQIATAADLIALGETPNDYDKHFLLTADIDLDPNLPGRKVFDRAVIAPNWLTPFTGILDGSDHAISHLTCASAGPVGLFGYVSGSKARIKNVCLTDPDITGGYCVGSLVAGCESGATIETCCVERGIVSGAECVGGLLGSNGLRSGQAGTVVNCRSDASVSGRSNIGGLVGRNYYHAVVRNCHSSGTVTGTEDFAGGLVGYNECTVAECSSAVVVMGAQDVGGLVGENGGDVTGCDSSGAVVGTGLYVGGLIGYNYEGVSGCHSTAAVSGTSQVGGLTGANEEGNVSDCYSTGAVSGTGDDVGGLVGSGWHAGLSRCYSKSEVSGKDCVGGLVGGDYSGEIAYCCATGAVSGNERVGGLVGLAWGATINDCYSVAGVSGRHKVGGLVGAAWREVFAEPSIPGPGGPPARWYYWWCSVSRCYAAGTVIGESEVGGLLGVCENDQVVEGQILLCFWDTQNSGQATSAGGTGKTTAEMQDPNTFAAARWDFFPDDIWLEPEGGGYPVLWWQLSAPRKLPTFSGGTGARDDPYRISAPTELNAIGHNPRLMGAHFTLVNDIDLAGSDFHIIGNQLFPFAGSFNGNAYTVSHLNVEGVDYLGLFGSLASGGEIKDLGVVDVNVVGSGCFIGGLVGYNDDGSLTHCYSTGTIKGDEAVGGLVGRNIGPVTQCHSAGVVAGRNYVGGLVGSGLGTLTQCYSAGAVTAKTYGGGLLGYGYGWERVIVIGCFWDIETSGQTSSAGGTGKTTAEMQTASTFLDAGWDFVGETVNGTEDIWWILEGKDYPRLAWEQGDGASP